MPNFLGRLALPIFLMAGHLCAQSDSPADPHAAQPERPTVATHAHTVAPGYLELEVGGQYAHPAIGSTFSLPVVAKVGVTSHTQLEFVTSYLRTRTDAIPQSGLTDVSAALKWRIADHTSIFGDIAVQPSVSFPTAPVRTVGTGTTGFSLLLISSRSLGPAEMDANVGITERTGNGTHTPQTATLWTVSFGFPLTDRLGGAAEVFGYPGTSGPAGTLPGVGLLIGPTYTLRPWLVFDTGAIFNVSKLGANSVYAGFTWNIGRL